jgi:hypothetical protein
MTIVFANSGEAHALEVLVNKTTAENLVLRLYDIDITPTDADAVTLYTDDECTISGYSAITLTGATWAAATSGDPSYITYPEQTFTFTYTGTDLPVYGYFVTLATSGTLIYAERFPGAPLNINTNGDTIKITPRIEAS